MKKIFSARPAQKPAIRPTAKWQQQVVISIIEALANQQECQIVVHTLVQSRLVRSAVEGLGQTFNLDVSFLSVVLAKKGQRESCKNGCLISK
ncbi:MAG: hypothetical protein COT26_01335 [Candidatus Kerfeldbacteria bacterium CG08_land_8_20_14_0_20_43_14]|uniref:Uncharacterized protein n=1 Tax=Candidatus Kerfeldbacteria bacterium CG08_land_8_20_14_0_20_43_14 TaxID=2014246 RepID=A0A2H0YQN2_9BACT|nr:MAG: hypothetical protein COT26_01335 [Candidatus Kerfeldbacteria bacterium CG08_land_8_20_14_0_20_43_14]